jgi:two-component system OmpR family response regulator
MARVLVIEDDASVSKLLRSALELAGHEVVVRSDGQAGLKAFQDTDPDVVVLDWMMPSMTGLEVLSRIRKAKNQTRVLLVTGKVAEADILRAWQVGIDGYLPKPFEVKALTRSVADLLEADDATLARRRSDEVERAKLLRALDELG